MYNIESPVSIIHLYKCHLHIIQYTSIPVIYSFSITVKRTTSAWRSQWDFQRLCTTNARWGPIILYYSLWTMCTHTKMVRAYTVVQVLVGHYVSSSVPGFLTCGAVALNIMYRGTGCRWEMGRDRKTCPHHCCYKTKIAPTCAHLHAVLLQNQRRYMSGKCWPAYFVIKT